MFRILFFVAAAALGLVACAGIGSPALPSIDDGGTSAPATPTSQLIASGGGEGPLEILVLIEIVAQETNFDSDGLVDIPMFAAASASFPAPGDPEVTVMGVATIDEHPVDAAGCSWDRTYASDKFEMTVLAPQPGSTGVSLLFEAPEWHYDITCPGGFGTRMPAFGETQMLAYLGYAFPEFGPLEQGPMDVPEGSGAPDCIKRELNDQRSVQLADVTLRVVIYEHPCDVLTPVPTP